MGEPRVSVLVRLLIQADLNQDPPGAIHASAFWDAKYARQELLKIIKSRSKDCPDCQGKGYTNGGKNSESTVNNHWTDRKTCAGCEGRRIVPKESKNWQLPQDPL